MTEYQFQKIKAQLDRIIELLEKLQPPSPFYSTTSIDFGPEWNKGLRSDMTFEPEPDRSTTAAESIDR